MPPSRVCDIESLITLSPNAVIFLFRFLVGACTLQIKGAEMLGNPQYTDLSVFFAILEGWRAALSSALEGELTSQSLL